MSDTGWALVGAMAACGVYVVAVEPFLRLLGQYNLVKKLIYRCSKMVAIPVPCSYGKWRILAFLFLIFPIQVESPTSPWSLRKHNWKKGLIVVKNNYKRFNLEWE